MEGPTDEERRQVAQLVWTISQRFGEGERGWDQMVIRLAAPPLTAKAWKPPKGSEAQPPGIPSGWYLLQILRLGGVLSQDFQLRTADDLLAAAGRHAEQAAVEAARLTKRTRGDRETDA